MAKDKARRFHALPRRQRMAARSLLIRGLMHELADIDCKARSKGERSDYDEKCREAIRLLLRRLYFHQADDESTLFQFRDSEFDDAAPTELRVIEGSAPEEQEELFHAPPPRAA